MMCLWCLLWMVISQYLSIRPAWLVVPSTLVSRIGCVRAFVWIPSRSVVRWALKLSIVPLYSRAFSTVDFCAHTRKGRVTIGFFGAFSGHVSLDLAVEASPFLLQLFLMFGEGSSGLGHVHFHGDRIVL